MWHADKKDYFEDRVLPIGLLPKGLPKGMVAPDRVVPRELTNAMTTKIKVEPHNMKK